MEPDADNVYLSSGTDNLALHRGTGVGPQGTGVGSPQIDSDPLDHFGLIVRQADDVDRWASFLESRGVTIEAPPRTHRDGAWSFYFFSFFLAAEAAEGLRTGVMPTTKRP